MNIKEILYFCDCKQSISYGIPKALVLQKTFQNLVNIKKSYISVIASNPSHMVFLPKALVLQKTFQNLVNIKEIIYFCDCK